MKRLVFVPLQLFQSLPVPEHPNQEPRPAVANLNTVAVLPVNDVPLSNFALELQHALSGIGKVARTLVSLFSVAILLGLQSACAACTEIIVHPVLANNRYVIITISYFID